MSKEHLSVAQKDSPFEFFRKCHRWSRHTRTLPKRSCLDRLIIKDVTGLFNPSAAPQIWYQRETDTVVHDGAETLTQMWQDHVTFLPLFEK